MRLLDRYIGTEVIKGYAMVLAILLSIFSFLALVEQLEDVGDGNFRTIDALIHVLLTLPTRMLDLAPVTVLLGSLVALSSLAKYSELIAIRAGGASMKEIGISIIKPSIALMILMYLALQFVVPPMQQFAETRRAAVISKSGDLLSGSGLWSRDGRQFINIRHMLHGRIPANINIYNFDQEGKLHTYAHADYADISDSGKWELIDVKYKELGHNRVEKHQEPTVALSKLWPRSSLSFQQLSKESLSLTGLYGYFKFLNSTEQKTDDTELLLWQRCLLPVSVVAMALLSIPFGFGLLRSSNSGKRLTMGAAVGVAFYLANQIIASVGLITGANPLLVAVTPILIVVLIASYLLSRGSLRGT